MMPVQIRYDAPRPPGLQREQQRLAQRELDRQYMLKLAALQQNRRRPTGGSRRPTYQRPQMTDAQRKSLEYQSRLRQAQALRQRLELEAGHARRRKTHTIRRKEAQDRRDQRRLRQAMERMGLEQQIMRPGPFMQQQQFGPMGGMGPVPPMGGGNIQNQPLSYQPHNPYGLV